MSSWNKLKFFVSKLPPKRAVEVYSIGRQIFLKQLESEAPRESYVPQKDLNRKLWGIDFRTPLFNSAGMFKDFRYYDLAFKQGAGAYLVGTLTPDSKEGNIIEGIHLPFAIYPKSHASSNSLGLPNKGLNQALDDFCRIERHKGFPVGISLASDSLEGLVRSLQLCESAGIDFIELPRSPNIEYKISREEELEYVSKHFLKKRNSNLPIIVKLSNDLDFVQIPDVMDLLLDLGYNGINLGNTSTDYPRMRTKVHFRDLPLYDFYTKNFKGGISGRPLKGESLELARIAAEYLKVNSPLQEFHVIRTGGIENAKDIHDSEEAGVSLNQWFTGYFENFIRHKNSLYKEILEKDG
jgi:dihydroorotate dehydrogenase